MGTKPAGAFSGFGFTVTPAMTSLTGASGELTGRASILRSLGYRMEKRIKPPEPVPVAASQEATPAENAAAAPADAAAAPTDTTESETAEHAPTLAPDVEPERAPDAVASEPPAETAVSADVPPAPEPAAESPVAAETAAPNEAPPSKSAPSEIAASVEYAPAAPAQTAPAEPEMIEVWRPGRPAGERRPRDGERRGRRRPERSGAKPEGQPAGETPAVAVADGQAVATGDATAPADGERKDRHGRPRHRRRNRGERKDGDGNVVEGAVVEAKVSTEQLRQDRPDRQGRPERRDRPDRKEGSSGRPPRRDRDRDRGRSARDNGPDRIWGSSEEPRSNKEPDPNSPFAKLLALKAQLEGNKERSVFLWIGSASTNGCGTRAWCGRVRRLRRCLIRAWFASTARASTAQAARCAPAMPSPSRSTAPCGYSR